MAAIFFVLITFVPFRPTCVPCKNTRTYIYQSCVFFQIQFLFSFRSAWVSQIILLRSSAFIFTNKLHSVLDRGSQIDCVYLDFSKAFDRVFHQLQLLKLSKLSIDMDVLHWIQSFLTHRSQFVHVNGINSSLFPVKSGETQGYLLVSLLFVIYNYNLPRCVSSYIILFADDCVLYREITNNSAISSFQSDLNSFSNWCDTLLLERKKKKI